MAETSDHSSALTYNESLQRYVDEFFSETRKERATAKEIAAWAIRTGRWEPPPDVVLRQCRLDIARAMREQYMPDEQGRPVRVKHVARVSRGDEQLHLWSDIRVASRAHMQDAFSQRRDQIVGDCRQLKRDVDYYNGHSGKNGQPIQMVFDFTDDIAEGEFPAEYPPKKPR